jgi:hypothetical protein
MQTNNNDAEIANLRADIEVRAKIQADVYASELELFNALKKLEWFDDPNYDGPPYCTVCRMHKTGKHRDSCWIHKLLIKTQKLIEQA